jgi:trehalose/maltose hydrolase-like predicted phosphorylase/beta-phosphoglucomutase-like phosphatase (HAD superfamily)
MSTYSWRWPVEASGSWSRTRQSPRLRVAAGRRNISSETQEVQNLLGRAGAPSIMTSEPADAGSDFKLVYESFDGAQEGLREALTSTGNGYFCIRGAAEWEEAGDVHYPGTYAHGVYNRESTIVGGRPVPNEDLVNLPRCLSLKLAIEGEDPIRLSNVELLSYRHSYDVRYALVMRELRFRDRTGRETSLRSRRFVSMGRMHLGALEWEIVAENWAGHAKVLSILDGRVLNRGVARYHQLWGRHLDPEGPRTFGTDVIALKVKTRQSRIEIAEAARTRVYRGDRELDVARSVYQMQDYIQQGLEFEVEQGAPVRVEKIVSLYTSRDRAINEPMGNAGKSVHRYPAFAEAFEGHVQTWNELWEVCDVRLPKEPRMQFLLRLHISHLLQVCSRLTPHHDAGAPARGLNGEAYRGHVFWDELYVYPFLNFRLPEITRGLLMYRYRRIGEARASAQKAGYRGAMYPWQSGSDGEEESQLIHINPLTGRWEPDFSHNQRHINAAIFYNVWHYYQATHDVDFLRDHGAEMMLEIARFWSSIAHFNPARGRWEIHGVMGPDEFHEMYPDAEEGGLRNNAYTNVMVAWICETAQEVLDLLPKSRRDVLRVRIGLEDEEIQRWREISRKMFIPFHADGIISQFEGYGDLQELDWDGYRSKYPNIQRLDRILRAEGDSPYRYSLSKQADTVMLFFLFSQEELGRLFRQLGYELSEDTARRTIDYYERRTSHGSTLSFVTHAGVLARIDPESSWQRFLVALESDIGDVQGGTTQEGIHLGVMAGTLDLVQRAYLGTEIRDDVLTFNPVMVDRLDGLRLAMQFRRAHIIVSLSGGKLTVTALADGYRATIKVGVGDTVRELRGGESATFTIGDAGLTAERRASFGSTLSRFAAAIFDIDGVLVDSPHETAWRETLRELMETSWADIRPQTTWTPERFTSRVYQQLVAGKPRMSGARAALEYFGLPDDEQLVEQYAERKQRMVVGLIEAGRFAVFPDALRLLLAVHAAGIPVAAASSSKNTGLMLSKVGLGALAEERDLHLDFVSPGLTLRDLIDADISGRSFKQGKPHPEIFLTAARELAAPADACFVIEDAVSGIRAAKAGGMAALGIARAGDVNLLTQAGADLVVTTLDDVDRELLLQGQLARAPGGVFGQPR